jgi:arylsulfatase A-like enzyme
MPFAGPGCASAWNPGGSERWNSFNPVYAAVVNTLDDAVGKLLAKLDELKLSDNTVVIFMSVWETFTGAAACEPS